MSKIHWSNAVDGDFDDAGSWSTGAVPGRNDVAVLGADGGAPYTVTASANEIVGRMSIARGDTLAITGGSFTVGHDLTLGRRSTIAVTGGSALTLKGMTTGFSNFLDKSVISVGDGSRVILKSAEVVSCRLTSTGSGEFIVKGQSILSIKTNGAIAVRSGASLSGRLFDFDGVTHLAKAGGAELTVINAGFIGGLVTLHGGDAIIVDVNQKRRKGYLYNRTDGVIAGAGQIGKGDVATGRMVLDNNGVIDARGQGLLTLDTGRDAIVNTGTIEATDRGRGKIRSAVQNSGVLKAAGGSLLVNRAVTGRGSAVIDNGTLAFGGAFSQDAAFTGASGVLKLSQSQSYSGAVSGFSKTGGTSLDLLDIGFIGAGEASFSGNHNSGVLTVNDGTHTAKITLVGDYTGVTFTAADDGHGGVSITDSQTAARATAASARHQFISVIAGFGDPGGPVSVWHDTGADPSRPVLSGPRCLH